MPRKAWDWARPPAGLYDWEEPMADVYPFVARLRAEAVRKVYDLGCGVGRHTVLLAREGFDVSATDLSHEGVRKTREWLEREGLKGDIRTADMVEAPFEEGEFGAVLAVNVVYHAPREDVARTLAEIARVLEPGGLMFVTFQSTRSAKYGEGRRVAPNTFVPEAGGEEGIPHFFAEEPDVRDLLGGFEILRLAHREDLDPAGVVGTNCHWIVEARTVRKGES